MALRISSNGIKFLSDQEGGFLLTAYQLKGEQWYTIGLGHYCYDNQVVIDGVTISVTSTTTITQAQAESLFYNSDAPKFESYVHTYAVSKFPDINQNQFDALFSYVYNRGPKGLQELVNNSSTIAELGTNMPIYWGGAVLYKEALINRRKREQTLFNTPVPDSPETPSEPETPPEPEIPEEPETESSLYIGNTIVVPYIYIKNKWSAVEPYLWNGKNWVAGLTEKVTGEGTPAPDPSDEPDTPDTPETPASTEVWTRTSRPESGNKYYNNKNSSTPGIATCITGNPVVDGLNTLKNCVGAAWGAFNETWAVNAPNNGPPGGWHAQAVNAHITLDRCDADSVLAPYVVRLADLPDPDNYIPPLGGLIVWSKQHIGYVSETTYNNKDLTKDIIYVEQSAWGGISSPGTNPETQPWANSDYGLWAHSKLRRDRAGMAKNCWWFNASANSDHYCIGFVKNPALLYDENGNCLGRRY